MVDVKEKTPGRWDGCGEGDGERPLLHKTGPRLTWVTSLVQTSATTIFT